MHINNCAPFSLSIEAGWLYHRSSQIKIPICKPFIVNKPPAFPGMK